jgi:hypothetical protein
MLALVSTGLAAAGSSLSYMVLGENAESTERLDTNSTEPTATETETVPAESIVDYGGIEGDSSIEAAETNVTAIHEASMADSENTVYLPEGEWYVGNENSGEFLCPGDSDTDRGAAGLGFVGDGPEKSFLTVAPHIPTRSTNIKIRYSEDTHHPDVEWKNLTYDGNEEALSLPPDRSQWGMYIQGSGAFSFENVRFRNFHANGIYGTASGGYSIDIDYCTFSRTAIGRHNNKNGEVVGHHLAGAIDSDQHLNVTNTEFELVSGTCLDLGSSSEGPVTFENCWAKGCGDGFIKVNNGGTTRISRLYFQGASDELTDELETEPGLGEHHGRNFIYRLDGDLSVLPKFVLNDVESHATPYHTIQVRRGYSIALEGGTEGPIAFSDIAGYERFDGAFRDDADEYSRLHFDIGELSVHNTVGNVFRTPDSLGLIETLNRGENGGLGEVGEIEIRTDNDDAEPFVPDTPSRDDVGINSFDGELE